MQLDWTCFSVVCRLPPADFDAFAHVESREEKEENFPALLTEEGK